MTGAARPAPVRGRRTASALLIAYDGVLWRRGTAAAAGTGDAALPAALVEAGTGSAHYVPALLGQVSRAAWRESVAATVADRVGSLGTAERIVEDWDAGFADAEAAAFVDTVAAAGVPVAVCVTGLDLDGTALPSRYPLVSAVDVGAAVPHPDLFRAACLAVRTAPSECLYVDPIARNVAGARAAGLLGYRWSGDRAADLRYLRAALHL